MRFVTALAVAALIGMTCAGCMMLGMTTVGTSRGEVLNPSPYVSRSGERVVRSKVRPEPMSADQLLEAWGDPDSRRQLPEGAEEWRYTGWPRWAGVMFIVVVVPVPLVVPVGLEHVTFVIEDELVVSASSANTELGFKCGVGWAPEEFHGGGWFAGCGGEVKDSFRDLSE